jgi:hypothetical protein
VLNKLQNKKQSCCFAVHIKQGGKHEISSHYRSIKRNRRICVADYYDEGNGMTEEFNKWWNEDLLSQDNPYVDGTAAFWAWEGWQAALAQPEQEPVKYKCTVIDDQHPQGIPLEQWGDPPAAQRKPLTDEQRQELMSKAWNEWLSRKDDGRLFAWSFSFEVEAAHGIGENT